MFVVACLAAAYYFLNANKKHNQGISFYHWKTTLNLSADEQNMLTQNKSPFYLHFMDVVWDEEKQFAVPTAQLQVETPVPLELPLVPVIYITNEVFEKMPAAQSEMIAKKLADRINSWLENPQGEVAKLHAIQVDCDWTLATKDKYFAFLKIFGAYFEAPLTATIRLHQVKYYQKTGVPPVSKGMLMFYNMGDLENPNTQNSILDLNIAQQYMSNFDSYPLALDVALPIFKWGVIQRDGKVVYLLNALQPSDLSDSLRFRQYNTNQYQVFESSYLNSYYCYEGDLIRLESITPEQLTQAVKLLSKHLKHSPETVCFYHLDHNLLEQFPEKTLKEIANELR